MLSSMDSSGLNRTALVRRAEFLFLAGRDFWDVGIGVDYLTKDSHAAALPGRVRKVLEEGLLIAYCRPFSGKSGRTVSPAPDLSEQLRQFHDGILIRRNQAYAHTDDSVHRLVKDLRSSEAESILQSFETAEVSEEWDSLTDHGFYWLRELARIHHRRVDDELARLRGRLSEG